MFDMNKCRKWAVDRSQNMGPKCGNILDIGTVRECLETGWAVRLEFMH